MSDLIHKGNIMNVYEGLQNFPEETPKSINVEVSNIEDRIRHSE